MVLITFVIDYMSTFFIWGKLPNNPVFFPECSHNQTKPNEWARPSVRIYSTSRCKKNNQFYKISLVSECLNLSGCVTKTVSEKIVKKMSPSFQNVYISQDVWQNCLHPTTISVCGIVRVRQTGVSDVHFIVYGHG